MSRREASERSAPQPAALAGPQVEVPIFHSLHGGTYTRTCRIPKGVLVTGVMIKIPTTVIIHGDALFLRDGKWDQFTGTHVLPAEAGRKQVVAAVEDTVVTMILPSQATSVEEAEREFTDEWQKLQSNRCACGTSINTHKEQPCQESVQAPPCLSVQALA